MSTKLTNKPQGTNHVVTGTGQTTEEIWFHQIDATSKIALLADGTVEYNGVEIATVTNQVMSAHTDEIIKLTQTAYTNLDPKVAGKTYHVIAD